MSFCIQRNLSWKKLVIKISMPKRSYLAEMKKISYQTNQLVNYFHFISRSIEKTNANVFNSEKPLCFISYNNPVHAG